MLFTVSAAALRLALPGTVVHIEVLRGVSGPLPARASAVCTAVSLGTLVLATAALFFAIAPWYATDADAFLPTFPSIGVAVAVGAMTAVAGSVVAVTITALILIFDAIHAHLLVAQQSQLRIRDIRDAATGETDGDPRGGGRRSSAGEYSIEDDGEDDGGVDFDDGADSGGGGGRRPRDDRGRYSFDEDDGAAEEDGAAGAYWYAGGSPAAPRRGLSAHGGPGGRQPEWRRRQQRQHYRNQRSSSTTTATTNTTNTLDAHGRSAGAFSSQRGGPDPSTNASLLEAGTDLGTASSSASRDGLAGAGAGWAVADGTKVGRAAAQGRHRLGSEPESLTSSTMEAGAEHRGHDDITGQSDHLELLGSDASARRTAAGHLAGTVAAGMESVDVTDHAPLQGRSGQT
ncbi:hypothetical protein FNF27_06038 [Cafeteria roenbergensis]|uniref:Uncharacterized protein n=1 Tax=Cafeteria roenbergensis TaxID=33653 RepID=A0A5A8E3V7_CAFRO|nr:hypothetical protein FNF27_06038 [Cafeteria roenbergensis]